MGFDYFERSNHSSEAVSLYEFSVGEEESDGTLIFGKKAWRYTSGNVDIKYKDNLYKAVSVNDNGASITAENQTDQFVVTIPTETEIGQVFLQDSPSSMVRLTVRRLNLGDSDAPIYWTGMVSYGDRINDLTTQFNCTDLTSIMARNGNRAAWTRGCRFALYDNQCRVDKKLWGIDTKIISLTGNSLTFSNINKDDGYFSGGFIEWKRWDDANVYDRRFIIQHTGSTATLSETTDSLSVGMDITIYPGCDRTDTASGCARFNNNANYGGFTMMPGRSPFDGNPVFY